MFNTDRNHSFAGYVGKASAYDCSPATRTEGEASVVSSHKSSNGIRGSKTLLPSPRSQKLSHFGMDKQASRLPQLAGSNLNLTQQMSPEPVQLTFKLESPRRQSDDFSERRSEIQNSHTMSFNQSSD